LYYYKSVGVRTPTNIPVTAATPGRSIDASGVSNVMEQEADYDNPQSDDYVPPAEQVQNTLPNLSPAAPIVYARVSTSASSNNVRAPLQSSGPIKDKDAQQKLIQKLIANNNTKEDKKLPCILCGERFAANKSKLKHWRLGRCKKLKIAEKFLEELDNETSDQQSEDETDTVDRETSSMQTLCSGEQVNPGAAASTSRDTTRTNLSIPNIKRNILGTTIPEFITEFQPDWRPGTDLNNTILAKIINNEEYEMKFRDFSNKTLMPLFQKTMILVSHASPLNQGWDSSDEKTQFKRNKIELLRMLQELRRQPDDEREENIEVTTNNMLEPSRNIHELKKKVKLFIEKQPARGQMQSRKEETTSQYIAYLFNDRQTSLKNYLKQYKSDITMVDLVFQKDKTVHLVEETIVQFLVAMPPSSGTIFCSAVISFLDYLIASAIHSKIHHEDRNNCHSRDQFVYHTRAMRQDLSKRASGITKQTKNTAEEKRRLEDIIDPEMRKKQHNAFGDYYKGTHFMAKYNRLKELALQCTKSSNVIINEGEWLNLGHWLMISMVLCHGARRQDGDLLKNKHFIMRRRAASSDNMESYTGTRVLYI
jgi:hypothetical protein